MSTTIANGYSYEYANLVRNVSDLFDQLRASQPVLLGLIGRGSSALATKEEWLEDDLAPLSTTITSFVTDGDGTVFNVASTAGIRVGAILRIVQTTGAPRTVQLKVTVVNSATQLTVVRPYGGTTEATLTLTDTFHIIAQPLNEGTDPGAGDGGQEPVAAFNYTQIFERLVKVSRTAQVVKKYGMASAIDYQVSNELIKIAYELNAQLIHGRRVQRSASENGTAGGVLQYLESGNLDVTGGALSTTILNNMLSLIFADGGMSSNFAILCAENQARKISAFNTTGSNPVTQVMQTDNQSAGRYVSRFVGDLPVQTGFTAKVVVDPTFPKDRVAILDLNKIELAWLANSDLTDMDATQTGADGVKRRIIGEATFRIRDGKKAHALATGLTI